MKLKFFLMSIVVLSVIAVNFYGCAAMKKNDAMSFERALAASGFQMKYANTPEKLEEISNMAQRKLVCRHNGDEVYYTYADALYCQCLYVGSEAAYQRFQRLAIEQNLAEEYRISAEMNQEAMMNWGMWGPWGPWY